jgi:PIN domain nuclease of toxin-antitoxin system
VNYLDTHVVAWLYAGEFEKLSQAAAKGIHDDAPVISPMVILELQYLYDIGRAKAAATAIENVLTQKRLWDPFDRIIVAHAAANDAPLITKDERIRRHYKRAVW